LAVEYRPPGLVLCRRQINTRLKKSASGRTVYFEDSQG
jgi:hypothetical protein